MMSSVNFIACIISLFLAVCSPTADVSSNLKSARKILLETIKMYSYVCDINRTQKLGLWFIAYT